MLLPQPYLFIYRCSICAPFRYKYLDNSISLPSNILLFYRYRARHRPLQTFAETLIDSLSAWRVRPGRRRQMMQQDSRRPHTHTHTHTQIQIYPCFWNIQPTRQIRDLRRVVFSTKGKKDIRERYYAALIQLLRRRYVFESVPLTLEGKEKHREYIHIYIHIGDQEQETHVRYSTRRVSSSRTWFFSSVILL